MKAMILAAGLGTRLRPLTDDRPKALVTLAGRTLLDIALDRLRSFGVREVIVNAHHYADRIVAYLAANDNFGMRIEVSREPVLLDTGGGLKKAAPFFLDGSASAQEPFIVHNVDVLSTIDLAGMMRFHKENNALATLAVQDRESSRYLLFDRQGRLRGRRAAHKSEPAPSASEQSETSQSFPAMQALAFSGIHIVSPGIIAKMKEEGVFSIIDAYLHLASRGEKILAFRADASYWRDLGRPESIAQAVQDLASGKYPRGRLISTG
jgi:NDP-sugar pyrophosphorylase family protein